MSMDFGWESWQLQALDDYILGYRHFDTQQVLANFLDKTLNSVKIKLTRRKKEISEEKRTLTPEEYITILSNRFSKSTDEIAAMLSVSPGFLLDQLDELDCLECKEYLIENYASRSVTNDEYELFIKLHSVKNMLKEQIAHILNRSSKVIQEMINEYERI